MRALVIFLLFSVLASEVSMKIFAVSDHQGVPAVLKVSVSPGTGRIYINVGSLVVGELTQESVEAAVEAACRYTDVNRWKYNFYIDIQAESPKIDGPSAGAAIALATVAALRDTNVPPTVSVTGTISGDGYVGAVGGIFEKAEAAAREGIKVFMIPKGQRVVNATVPVSEETSPGVVITHYVTKTVDIVEYARENWDMNVVEVETLADVVSLALGGEVPGSIEIKPREPFEPRRISPPPYTKPFASFVEKLLARIWDANEVRRIRDILDRGYLYTAANEAFLDYVDQVISRRVEEHPSVKREGSLARQRWEDELRERAEKLLMRSRREMNEANYQMVAGAQQRILRALVSLDGDLDSLASAEAWLDAAELMLEEVKDLNGDPVDVNDAFLDHWVMEAQDSLEGCEAPSVQVRERALEEARKRGLKVAALFLAAEVKGLCDARDVNVSDLEVDANTLWAYLYETHGLYYLQKSQYASKYGDRVSERSYRLSAIRMYLMGKYYDMVARGVSKKSEVRSEPQISVEVRESPSYLPYVLAAAGALLVFAFAMLSREDRIERLRKMYLKGKISREEYLRRVKELRSSPR